jgi:elongation factor Ts
MPTITIEKIKELRDKTGVSIMQCKKALEESGGDYEKAIIILKKKGSEIASQKGGRELKAGVVAAYIHSNGSIGAMVELLSESDFVSNHAEFRALAYDLAMHIAAFNPEFLKKEDIRQEDIEQAKAVFAKEVEGKAPEIKDKILQGKLDAYFSERIFLEQPFVKNADVKVSELISNAVQKFGERIEIGRFVRFSLK